MNLPAFATSPPWLRFFAAAAIFIAWFVILLAQYPLAKGAAPLLDPHKFISVDKYVLMGLVGYHAADKTASLESLWMRLVAGIGLLGMWVWLAVDHITPPAELTDALAVGLVILGVVPGATSSAEGSAPPVLQGGFARPPMLAMLAALAIGGTLVLQACSSFSQMSPIQQASIVCANYRTAQQVTLSLKQAGKLTPVQLSKFKTADAAAVKACNAPPPTTAASEAAWASNVTAQIAVLTAINNQGAK